MSSNSILPIAFSVSLSIANPIQIDSKKNLYNHTNEYTRANSCPFFAINPINSDLSPIRFDYRKGCLKRIDSFRSLSVNWDGYNAEAPENATIKNAQIFISVLPDYILKYISEENITPTPYGTIVFDFKNQEDLLSIEVGEREIGFFTDYAYKENKTLETSFFNKNKLPLELLESFKNLYKTNIL